MLVHQHTTMNAKDMNVLFAMGKASFFQQVGNRYSSFMVVSMILSFILPVLSTDKLRTQLSQLSISSIANQCRKCALVNYQFYPMAMHK